MGVAKFKTKHYLGAIITDILTKFDSLSSYIPRDLRVHTNKYDLIDSIVNTEQEYIYFKVKQTYIYGLKSAIY